MLFHVALLTILVQIISATVYTGRINDARCEARCLAKINECNETCHEACFQSCRDVNFHKVKSCNIYCQKWSNDSLIKSCKHSCKFMLKLYNLGGSKPKMTDNLKKNLPERPTAVITTITTPKRGSSKMHVSWYYNKSYAIFMLEARYVKEKPYSMSEWTFLQMVNSSSIDIIPRTTAVWIEIRVKAVNEFGASDYSSPSKPVHIIARSPSPPRDFRVLQMRRQKGYVAVTLGWSKPLFSDIPVHKYKILWSHRLDEKTKEFHSIPVYEKKVSGGTHYFTINGLNLNTTYVFEIQAFIRYKGKRLRSNYVKIRRRTLDIDHAKLYKKSSINKQYKRMKSIKKASVKIMKDLKMTGGLEERSKKVLLGVTAKAMQTKETNVLKRELQTTKAPTEDTPSVQASSSAARHTVLLSWVCLPIVFAFLL